MKRFKDLSPKEIKLWEKHIQKQLDVKRSIPEYMLKAYWMEMYKNSSDKYDPVFNSKPKTQKELEPDEEHRTVVEDYLDTYYKEEVS